MPLFLLIFLKGLLIGFSIAAPVGPIGFLCIRASLNHGRWAGLAIGAGAACADTIYGMLGISGLALVYGFIHEHEFTLRLLGGIVVMVLGMRILLAPTPSQDQPPKISGVHIFKSFSSAFLLTLTNPLTIFAFIAIFAAFGLSFGSYAQAGLTVAGVFSGSLLWWLILSSSVARMRGRITNETLHHINMAAGVIIAAFGAFAFLYVLW